MEKQKPDARQYFLGNCSAAETEAIELQIIEDAEFAGEFSGAESALIEDYLDKKLSPAENKLFQTNFLSTPERRNRLEMISLLRTRANFATQNFVPERFSMLARLRKLWLLNFRPVAIGFSLLAVILLVGTVWRSGYFNSTESAAEKAVAALNQKDLSNLSDFKDLRSLSLISGTLRGGGETNAANILRETETPNPVLLRLALQTEVSPAAPLTVKLMRDKKVLLTLNQIHVYKNQSGQEIRFLLPPDLLKKGAYQIDLLENKNAPTSAALGNYSFTVQ